VRGPFLLDTNVLIWSISASKRLSVRARRVMSLPVSSLWVSVISIWEIVLKFQVHKLQLQAGLDQTLDQILTHPPWDILSMKTEHLRSLVNVPVLHLDPFDRMLIAQARYENLTILTADEQIREYDVRTLW
jgi:PIN domain nuclease of toxin-antitoxin system